MHPPRLFLLLAFLLLVAPFASAAIRPFSLERDTFAFSNDTVFAYGVDEAGELHIARREKPVQFSHRCFVLSRGVLQFYQFARFDPRQPRLTREQYRRRILQVSRIPVWSRGPRDRIVIPGYRDLRAFSAAWEGLLKENLGQWFPTYVRVGNYRMGFPLPRAGQAAAARWLAASLDAGRPRAIYMARFPKMNHVVVPYAVKRLPAGDLEFTVYDPNYPGKPSRVWYRAAERSFDFERRWYFPGGRVNVMRVFLSPFH